MREFADVREAKQFLVERIVETADRVGVPLSETERRMMYFSETGWTLPDIDAVDAEFRSDYYGDEYVFYETKICELADRFRAWAKKTNPEALDDWTRAVKVLGGEDHYLLVLIDPALAGMGKPGQRKPVSWWLDRLRLVATAFLVICAAMAISAIVIAIGDLIVRIAGK